MAPSDLLTVADALFERLIGFLRRVPVERVTCYVPVGYEPGGPALPDRLAAELPSSKLAIPILLPDLDLDWALYTGPADVKVTSRGLYEPTGPRLGRQAVASAQVLIVPALAVDTAGNRLGRGGGSYDRALARAHPSAVAVALLHTGELLENVPHDTHDIPVTTALLPLER